MHEREGISFILVLRIPPVIEVFYRRNSTTVHIVDKAAQRTKMVCFWSFFRVVIRIMIVPLEKIVISGLIIHNFDHCFN